MGRAAATLAATRPNRLARTLGQLDRVPAVARPWARNLVLRRAVPFTGTAGLQYVALTPQRVEVAVANQRRVQNHIHGVHAAAMALLAETATGFCVGMNLPDDKLPLIKTLHVDYLKRAQGDMKAVAQLSPEQIRMILTEDKGEVTVPVSITDESGQSPIACQMVWAWVPKKR